MFSISEVLVSSEISGKFDSSRWLNKANIMTPDFRKLACYNGDVNFQSASPKLTLSTSCSTTDYKKLETPEE